MATSFLPTANPLFLPCSSSSSSSLSPAAFNPHKNHLKSQIVICNAFSDTPIATVSRRGLAVSFLTTTFLFSLDGRERRGGANAAILEADDDVELLKKVKKDRKKRLERQGIINSSKTEKGYLQDLVYKLSEVGRAIDNNDLSAASSVLGGSTETEWLQKANLALTKLTVSPEEKTEVDTFNSSVASLISSVTRKDIESSKVAFITSASAFERWTTLTGLVEVLKGL
ncbi:thylakoid lumenal 16.5 kDa protein, chloroplastic [Rhodamnia argentea]|uniref:Thylakoid lumenal 16.5 kDa protein, chloroplastic n=1 Tax=Rhodamnia argentea TaxID=178133 RepID=A0A8B8MXC5_9MYRT|nr:thylakoid lumenal 16.5 kDa protein, chloroplastic [Rhodamnia argentea]